MVILPDDPRGRPDPLTGQIPVLATGHPGDPDARRPSRGRPRAGGPSHRAPMPRRVTITCSATTLPPRPRPARPMPQPLPPRHSAARLAGRLRDRGRPPDPEPATADDRCHRRRPTAPDLPVALPAPAVEPLRHGVDPRSSSIASRSTASAFSSEGGGTGTTRRETMDTVTLGDVPLYSVQRLQPYRGGHAVPVAPGDTPFTPLDAYGYSEQTSPPTVGGTGVRETFGMYGDTTMQGGTGMARSPSRSTTRSARRTTRARPGITCRSTTATSPAWPNS